MAIVLRRSLAAALISLLAMFALVPAASAHGSRHKSASIKLKGGATFLALNAGTAKALTDNGFKVTPVEPASVTPKGRIKSPITYGKVNRETLAGKIRHTGGLSLTKGDTRVALRNFVIDTKRGVLTARVGDARLAILDLDLSDVEVAAKGRRLTVSGVSATLTKGAADALNGAFGTTAFAEGLAIGTAVVRTRARAR
jgi:hypothetical protein